MIFAHGAWTLGLLLLPLLAWLEWRALGRAERATRSLVGQRAGNALLAQSDPRARRLGVILRLAALALLILGAAEPQWGHESVRRRSQGSDLVFAIDVSASMDTRDVAPSRLDEARREALGLLDRVEGSRVGVLAFAGDAVRLCPLTADHAAVRLTLETLESGSVSTPGTDLDRALRAAVKLLPAGRREEQAIVLWTDGEDLEGHAKDAIAVLRREGVRVFAVGVGTPLGDVIPVLDDAGRPTEVKHDENGAIVHSHLDEGLLRDLARATRGGYFSAARMGGELPRLAAAMGSLARSSHGSKLIERPIARFPLCALLAGLLLAADLVRPRRRMPARAAAVPRGPRPGMGEAAAAWLVTAIALAGLALVPAPARAQSAWARADAAFRAGRWAQAESLYARRALHGAPPAVLVDLATARAQLGKLDSAQTALKRWTADSGSAGRAAGYNLGTIEGGHHDLAPALAELRRALERDPNDADARWNYELLRRRQQDEDEKKKKPEEKPQKAPPQPQPQGGGAGGKAPPPPQPNAGAGQKGAPPNVPPNDSPPQGGGSPGMTRQQAERLLGSLQELERLEKQHARRVRALEEKKGRDW